MVAIAPFRALRYAPGTDLAEVTSPPHDCISAAEADAFRQRAHNIVRISLPAEQPGDGDGPGPPSKFARAAQELIAWQADATLRRDAMAAYYLYQATHGAPDERRSMTGLFVRLALDATGTEIRPHEHTLSRPKKERLRLREATQTDVEPIWLLYRDPRGWVDEILHSNAFEELCRFTDEAGIEHRLWRIDRYEAVTEVTAQFDDRDLVIADGHHRYRTALEQYAASGNPAHGSILACLVRDNDPGLRIEPTHRLLHSLPDADPRHLLQRAEVAWTPREISLTADLSLEAERLLGLLGEDRRRCVAVWRNAGRLQAFLLESRAKAAPADRLADLAVTRVHDSLLTPWGVQSAEANVRYARDAVHALREVAAGACQAAVLLPPEPVDAVLEVARAGQLMPQKATYFVPKLRSGLVLSPLDEAMPTGWKERAGGPGKADFRLPPLG